MTWLISRRTAVPDTTIDDERPRYATGRRSLHEITRLEFQQLSMNWTPHNRAGHHSQRRALVVRHRQAQPV